MAEWKRGEAKQIFESAPKGQLGVDDGFDSGFQFPIVDMHFAAAFALNWQAWLPKLRTYQFPDDYPELSFAMLCEEPAGHCVLETVRYNISWGMHPDSDVPYVRGFTETHLALPIMYSTYNSVGLSVEYVTSDEEDTPSPDSGIYVSVVSAPMIGVHYYPASSYAETPSPMSLKELSAKEIASQGYHTLLLPDIPTLRPELWERGLPWKRQNRPQGIVFNLTEQILVLPEDEFPDEFPPHINRILGKSKKPRRHWF